MTGLADGQQALEVYKAEKLGSGNNVGGNESETFSSKFSSQLTAIVDAQTRLGGKVPVAIPDILNLAVSHS